MRIGLLGQFGSGNFGNDGSLEAMLSFLRHARSDLDLLAICSGPDRIRSSLGLNAIGIGAKSTHGRAASFLDRLFLGIPRRLRNLAWAWRHARKLDVMIVPGTGIFDDFSESPFGWPYVVLRWCLAARLNSVPVFFVSIGAGPVRHPLSRLFIAVAARTASFRSFRDGPSRDFVAGLGIDTASDPVNCDLALRLPPAPEPARPAHNPICVGVGVMAYQGWEKNGRRAEVTYQRYLEKMRTFIEWLLARGLSVRLLTGGSVDGRAVRDLLETFSDCLPDGALRGITAVTTDSLRSLMQEIAQTDIVVATRYHNVVCALNMARPTISVGYAAKNDDLLERVGSAGFCTDVETFTPEILEGYVDRVLEQRAAMEGEIRDALIGFRAQLDAQDILLSQRLALVAGDAVP